MSKPGLLYLTHRIPYPPNKGDKIRSFHLLKHLSQQYQVHLGTFVDADEDWQYVDHVKQFCSETCFVKLDPVFARVRCLSGLIRNQPLTLPYYENSQLQQWVDSVLATRSIERIIVFSSAMAQYVRHVQNIPRLIDFVDIDSDKWRQYAETKSWPVSWVYQREAGKLFEYEKDIARAFDCVTFVSKKESDIFRQLFPDVPTKVNYFNNGVDIDYFSPLNSYPNPYVESNPVLVFTGAMDYWANVDAVVWFTRSIFPEICARVPDVQFYIVGSRPANQILALAKIPGVTVTGAVADIRPYLMHAACAVAPLRIARGIQNKVLEAMAMGKAVIASPQAMEGISAIMGKELFVADGEAQFVNQAVQLVMENGSEAMGKAARERILADYSWHESLARIDQLLMSVGEAI